MIASRPRIIFAAEHLPQSMPPLSVLGALSSIGAVQKSRSHFDGILGAFYFRTFVRRRNVVFFSWERPPCSAETAMGRATLLLWEQQSVLFWA